MIRIGGYITADKVVSPFLMSQLSKLNGSNPHNDEP